MYKILLVEDDAGIAKEIADYAAGWGLEVHIAKNFENIMAEFAKVKPHLDRKSTRLNSSHSV